MAPLAAAQPVPALASWAPSRTRLGLYVHLPFCRARCGYCAFNTAPYEPGAMARFLAALKGETDLVSRAPWTREVTLSTVFFGGGTPSLTPPEEMAALLERIRGRFTLAPDAEVTVECNPESVSREKLTAYRRAGVNRISLGVQSLDDGLLATLDRVHAAADARRAFDAAREAGFNDVSCDLIYGLPGLETPTWERTVRELLGWGPDHLSAYALSLEEGSLWHSRGVAGRPGEDAVAEQYWGLARLAAAHGYEHYEVSNYARPGRRSAHNQIYWRAEEYLALGPGASGFLGQVRYTNVKPVERYWSLVEAGEPPVGQHETLTSRQRLAERLFLGLRLADGVPATWLDERAALEPGRLPRVLEAWHGRRLLTREGARVRLTEAGFLLSDALFIELL
ncbi:MAG TPA: radical SAM family heme chaperone HemW [Methylomirabilota bacterium]|nr:radical SAM family heme chaperone HemW [Methylomirabilota bacterium]